MTHTELWVVLVLNLLCFISLAALRQMLYFVFRSALESENRPFLFRRFVLWSAIKLTTFAVLLLIVAKVSFTVSDLAILLGCAGYVWMPMIYAVVFYKFR